MPIFRGPQDVARRAKNYTSKQAQARLNETVPTFNDQVINSLFVDGAIVDYYRVHDKIGQPCSCRKTELDYTPSTSPEEGIDIAVPAPASKTTSIKLQDTGLFGDSDAERIYEEHGIDVSGGTDYDPSIPDVLFQTMDRDGNVDYQSSVTEGNVDCAICYRTGVLPGYSKYGTTRSIFCSVNIANIDQYFVDKQATPHEFQNTGKGNVYFEVLVPKYYAFAAMSIRFGKNILKGECLYYKGVKLTDAILRRAAGTKILISVQAPRFTHVILEFDLGGEPIRGNLSGESQSLDYNLRDFTADFTVVLPPTIREVRALDVLVIRSRRLVLKVKDKERKTTVDGRQLEWVVQTRLIQPQEVIKNIYKTIKIG